MKIPDFELERWKAKHIAPGVIDLTETGVPEPLKVGDIFKESLLDLVLDYAPLYGGEELRERIAELYQNVKKDNVLVTSSTSEGNMIAANVGIANGDEVLVQIPAFMQLPGLVEAIGTRINYYRLEEEDKFELDLDKFNEKMSPKTKAIVLNFPNNPTGRTLGEKEVKALCEIARDHDAWIIADEVYRGIEFDGPFSPSFAEYYEKAIVTSSLSKVWGLAGLRIGWIIAPRAIIEGPASAYKEYTSLGCSLLSEHLATMALEKPIRERLVQRGRRLVRESLEVFEHWMETQKEVFSWIRPRFGVIALVKQTLGISSSDFAERVYRGRKVALVPCDTVFPDLTDYLRISYCHPPKKLAEALGRVSDEVTNVRAGRGEVVA